jgi:hypothetical protein
MAETVLILIWIFVLTFFMVDCTETTNALVGVIIHGVLG